MTNIQIITTADVLQDMCLELASAKQVSIDTEFMREKTYFPELSLIQLSAGDVACCIDPLALDSIDPFLEVLERDGVETILHSCRQDFEAIDTRSELVPSQLFDTQIAAAFCGYGDQVSYAAMVDKVCGVQLAKSHTRADWSARPLSTGELEYAMDDVRYLGAVRDFLLEKLNSLGRVAWFENECAVQLNPKLWQVNVEQAWKRLKGAARLPVAAQETAKQLAVWREDKAVKRNRPREWILSSKALLEVARNGISTIQQLSEIEGINQGVMRQSGNEIVGICQSAPRDQSAPALWSAVEMLEPAQRKQVKSIMSEIRETAESMDMAPSLLANRSSIEQLVRGNRELPVLEGWRAEVIGNALMERFG